MRVGTATVRAAYPGVHCYSYIQEIDCLPARTYADGTVLVASGAAAATPAYYWVLGAPTRWFGPVTALYLMRGLDALVCSLLVALAAWCLTRWSRTAWPLLGLALTCTPMAMYSGSTPAPNGRRCSPASRSGRRCSGWPASTPGPRRPARSWWPPCHRRWCW